MITPGPYRVAIFDLPAGYYVVEEVRVERVEGGRDEMIGPDYLPVPEGWERVVQITGRVFLRRLPWCYVWPDGYGKWGMFEFDDVARTSVHKMRANLESAEVACDFGDAWWNHKEGR